MLANMPDAIQELDQSEDLPLPISYLVRILRAYRAAIGVAIGVVLVAYLTIACVLYLAMPTQRITAQRFRLEFEGAENAQYPNGVQFAPSDITATPVLL